MLTDKEVVQELLEMEEPNVTRKLKNKKLNIKVQLITIDSMKTYFKTTLIDSGCTSFCISQKFT